MSRPGTQVTLRQTPPSRSAPTDTGIWFVAGITEKGPLAPVYIRSLAEYVETFGERVSYGVLYDAADLFFREGGDGMYISRVVGPAPVEASYMLHDSEAADTLLVEAKTVGVWGNDLQIQVTAGDAGGEFKLVVLDADDVVLETSPSLATKDDAVTWAEASSDYIKCTDQASLLDPAVVAATPLVGGTDDHANAVDANWAEALALFRKDLGPGQVSMPGRTTGTAHTEQLGHAVSNNRVAILDLADTATVATLTAATAAAATVVANQPRGAAFAPWVVIPGITPGTTRTVAPSAMVAGVMGRNDSSHSPNEPSAGELGRSQYVIGLSQDAWSDDDREDLNVASVNVIRELRDGFRIYGYRSLADPVTNWDWVNFANCRLAMAIVDKGDTISESYVLKMIDGRGITLSGYGGDLTGMLKGFYESGALFGEAAGDAFFVDVGAQVNTPETLAAQEIHAVMSVRMSPFGELVALEIVNRPITEEVV